MMSDRQAETRSRVFSTELERSRTSRKSSEQQYGKLGVVTVVILYVLFTFGAIAVAAMIFGAR